MQKQYRMNQEAINLDVELHTPRLILKVISEQDEEALYPLINDADVSYNLGSVPYPYPKEALCPWIEASRESVQAGACLVMAIHIKNTGKPIGVCSIYINDKHLKAEIGYWIGKPYWNNGYMTEAISRMIEYGFDDIGLYRIFGRCFARNKASARVMEKSSMKQEGYIKADFYKDGEHLDSILYGITAADY